MKKKTFKKSAVIATAPTRVYREPGITKSGITPSPEFAKKGLANFAINVGAKCGHDCTYCSTGCTLRHRVVFQNVNENPFDRGYAIVDDEAPTRVATDAKKIDPKKRKLAQLCTLTDAWAPETLASKLGRKCLEAILNESDWHVRILTKNAAVENEFDLLEKHRERVTVGLSLTGTPDKEKVVSSIEPHASLISDRMRVLKKAHKMGLRTYGMLCPLMPEIADSPAQIERLVEFVLACGAEEIFSEPVNPRGRGLIYTQSVLLQNGFEREAIAVGRIRKKKEWGQYAIDLLRNIQTAVKNCGCPDKLRFLFYPSKLTKEQIDWVNHHSLGVKKLGKPEVWT